MNYANYDTSIIQKYHVKLDGWPAGIAFATPHNICTVDEIRLLRHHLREKNCKWIKLTEDEVQEHMEGYAAKVQKGIAATRKRKICSDKGKPRKKRTMQVNPEDEEDIAGFDNGNGNGESDAEGVARRGPDDSNGNGELDAERVARRSQRIAKGKYKSKPFVSEGPEEDESYPSGDEYNDDSDGP